MRRSRSEKGIVHSIIYRPSNTESLSVKFKYEKNEVKMKKLMKW